jgi:hypothetical protein
MCSTSPALPPQIVYHLHESNHSKVPFVTADLDFISTPNEVRILIFHFDNNPSPSLDKKIQI